MIIKGKKDEILGASLDAIEPGQLFRVVNTIYMKTAPCITNRTAVAVDLETGKIMNKTMLLSAGAIVPILGELHL